MKIVTLHPAGLESDWPPDESKEGGNFFDDGQAQKVSEKLSALTSNSDRLLCPRTQ